MRARRPRQTQRLWRIGSIVRTIVSVFASVTSHRELVENLTMRDIKSRYKQSILGYAWAVANPFIYAIIFTIVAQKMLKMNAKMTGIPFPVFAYFGLLFWNLFTTGLSSATESLVANLSLITKVYFPREVFPISAVLSKLSDLLFGLLGLLPLLFFYHLTPSLKMVLVLPIMVVIMIFTTGVGFLAACANLFYRDVRQVIALVTSVLGYFVPNLYPLSQVPDSLRTAYLLNPMATLIEAARRATFPQAGHLTAPDFLPFIGYATLSSILVFVVGFVAFKHYETRFAEFI